MSIRLMDARKAIPLNGFFVDTLTCFHRIHCGFLHHILNDMIVADGQQYAISSKVNLRWFKSVEKIVVD